MAMVRWTPTWQSEDFEIKENNSVYEGFFHVKRFLLRHRSFSGEWSAWVSREQIRRADAVAAILFDPKNESLVMVEQFRTGLVNVYPDQSPWLLEVVAGLLEPGESTEDALRREAKEETDCDITQLLKITDFYNSPGGFAEKTTLYCGIVDSKDKVGVMGQAHEHEDIRVHVLPVEEVLTALTQGKWLTSSSTVIALQWLSYHLKNGSLQNMLT